MYTQDEILKAKKRVKAKKGFYQHLMSFAIVNAFLITLNLLTSAGHLWFVYPFLGWGVGLAFHYVEVFGIPGFDVLSKEWEDRELDTELRKIREAEKGPILKQTGKTDKQEELDLKELRRNYDEKDFV